MDFARLVAVAVTCLTAAACVPASQGGFASQPSPRYQLSPQATGVDQAQVRRIATRFARDRANGGMVGTAADVRQCYRAARTPTATLDCVGLDYVATKREAYNVQRFHVGTSDYFTAQGLQARSSQAARQVGYTSDQMLAYMGSTGDAASELGASM